MKQLFGQLDVVLRGDATRMSALRDGRIDINIRQLSVAVVVAAAFAGLCMGSFAVVRGGVDGLLQMLASAIKLPMLFVLTLVVTFPSLYVFNALVGSRLTWESVLRLLVAANGVIFAVFASLGPIIVFFGLSTTSYPFMKMLNVLAAGVGGVLGLAFLLRTLHRLILVQEASPMANEVHGVAVENETPGPDASSETEDDTDSTDETQPRVASTRVQDWVDARRAEADAPAVDSLPGALDRMDTAMPDKARTVFRVWVVVYGVVGAQMGWVLRPFIGAPGMEFSFFRDRQSNFFLDLFENIGRLFGG